MKNIIKKILNLKIGYSVLVIGYLILFQSFNSIAASINIGFPNEGRILTTNTIIVDTGYSNGVTMAEWLSTDIAGCATTNALAAETSARISADTSNRNELFATNIAMKIYVDATDDTETSARISGDTSNRNELFATNTAMKIYVDAADDTKLSKSGDTAGSLTVTNLTYLYDNHLHATNPIGDYAFSAGYGLASGIGGIAIGGAQVSNVSSHTIFGWSSAEANGAGSVSIGANNYSSFYEYLGITYKRVSIANGAFSLALMGGTANGDNSCVLMGGTANGDNSCALMGGTANNDNSCALMGGTANNDNSCALMGGTANGDNSCVLMGGTANGDNSCVLMGGTANGDNSCALMGGLADGKDSFAVGSFGGTRAAGDRSVSLGGESYGNGSFTTADGNAYGNYSVAMCDGICYTQYFGHSNGNGYKLQNGNESFSAAGGHTFGYKSIALIGAGNTLTYEATGYQKHTSASNDYTFAVQPGSVCTGINSTAFGGKFAWRDDMIALPDIDIQGEFLKDLSMGGNKITNLANGVSANDAANIGQVQAMTNGCLQTSGNNKIWLTDSAARTNNCIYFDGEYFVKWTRFYTNSTAAVTNEVKTKMVQ